MFAAPLAMLSLLSGHPASVPTDACSVLTVAQVSAALGVTVTAGQHLVATAPNLCGWAPAGGPSIGGKKLTVTLMTERSYTIGKTPMHGITKTPVSGVGDEAYYVTTPGFGTALSVKKGDVFFQIRVGGFPEDRAKAVEKTLALDVLAKL